MRELTRRTRGHRLADIIAQLRDTLLAWKAYFGIAEVLSPPHDIDKWIRHKLRCYLWKQWGRAAYTELRRRGVSVREAWHTRKLAHGPWRLSITPALALALPGNSLHRTAGYVIRMHGGVRGGAARLLPIPISHPKTKE